MATLLTSSDKSEVHRGLVGAFELFRWIWERQKEILVRRGLAMSYIAYDVGNDVHPKKGKK